MKLTHHSATTAEKILETTFDLLSRKGNAGVAMRDIAAAAEVSVSQIAYHFGSREGLMAQVLRHVSDRCYEELEKLTSSRHILKERLDTLGEYFRGMHEKNLKLFCVLLDFMTQSIWVPAYKDEINRFFRQVGDMIAADFAALTAEGEQLMNDTAEAVNSVILSALIGSGFQTALGFQNQEEEADEEEVIPPRFA